ncbi:MAG: prolipoprotein diacylglyceryl transferase [Sedimentisphaerales bacterium]|nr:prolipoprotein diacylglyceryl transferase [Sedimentisphaerales bacterium]
MRPELFVIPFINVSIKSYGFMMACGFLAALLLARWRSRKLGENPDHITNFSVLTLIAGVIGARLHYVLHRFDHYQEHPAEIFAISSGGLEFLGGFILAALVTGIYLRRKKLPTFKYLDILAPALMLGLAFGRIGCLLNGCCFGAPCELPWAVRFPVTNNYTQGIGCNAHNNSHYSLPYSYQINPDENRRPGIPPIITLSQDYYVFDFDGNPILKAPSQLTPEQLHEMQHGQYQMHPIHPTQLYSCINALILCLILSFLFRFRHADGQIFALMMIMYGSTRFIIELLRIDNPLEFDGMTISQNLGILAVVAGIVMLAMVQHKTQKNKK